VAAVLPGGAEVGYVEVLKARGQLRAQTDPIPMGVPPGGAAFVRGNAEMLSLEGARCAVCGTVSTPPSIHPHCIGCGSTELETVALARRGTVQTFVVNQTMPPPFTAPLPLVVLDLEDGARLMVQGTSADAGALAVGDEMVLTLRRYAVERAIPVYGYKAVRRVADPVGAETGDRAAEEVAP
jgi:hydroxymethylglutaryl-CoA synthase